MFLLTGRSSRGLEFDVSDSELSDTDLTKYDISPGELFIVRHSYSQSLLNFLWFLGVTQDHFTKPFYRPFHQK